MNYEIKIENAKEGNGKIDLQRLVNIAQGIRRISEGALQIRLRGISLTSGRKKVSLEDALRVTLTGIKDGSVVLNLETETFANTLGSIQMDLFRQGAQAQLPDQTPMSLFIHSFQDAMSDNTQDQEMLDKYLLKELKQFNKAFKSENEVFIISNQRSVPSLELKCEDFKKIKTLEEKIPEPEPMIINGVVEELKYSKLKVRILTSEGIVDGFLGDDLDSQAIANCWGKEVSIVGTAHYKPGGKAVIEIRRIFESSEGDKYFSKNPKSETLEQQLERQIREGKKMNPLPEMVGKWPGDESFEELLDMLTK